MRSVTVSSSGPLCGGRPFLGEDDPQAIRRKYVTLPREFTGGPVAARASQLGLSPAHQADACRRRPCCAGRRSGDGYQIRLLPTPAKACATWPGRSCHAARRSTHSRTSELEGRRYSSNRPRGGTATTPGRRPGGTPTPAAANPHLWTYGVIAKRFPLPGNYGPRWAWGVFAGPLAECGPTYPAA